MKVTEESIAQTWDEAFPLLEKHWAEIAHYKDIPFEPSKEVYLELDSKGLLKVYIARTDEGQIIGYAVYVLRYHPHYKSSLQAVQDVLYVDPAHRGGVGRQLIRECDARLKALGVQVVYHHMKASHNFGPLLERMGYELQDLIYCKRLDKED